MGSMPPVRVERLNLAVEKFEASEELWPELLRPLWQSVLDHATHWLFDPVPPVPRVFGLKTPAAGSPLHCARTVPDSRPAQPSQQGSIKRANPPGGHTLVGL